ncbi:MAG: GNAT family N-acetyltransferase [Anaerolineales bacterium]|nr:GNAT family N-acetyltransferase [Anaerolineales bacterium]
MDIDLSTPVDQIEWEQDQCPWNQDEGSLAHRCAIKDISICPFFCGVEFLDVVLCSYPNPNPHRREQAAMSELAVQGPVLGKSEICEPILKDLPEWFGIAAANQQYLKDINELPTFLAIVQDKAVGFLTLKEHSPFAAEIHILGVRPEFHRQGIGRSLVQAGELFLKNHKIEFLQVKTLSDSHPDENYTKTRAFYRSMGYKPLEEFRTYWGEANPCLQMIKFL